MAKGWTQKVSVEAALKMTQSLANSDLLKALITAFGGSAADASCGIGELTELLITTVQSFSPGGSAEAVEITLANSGPDATNVDQLGGLFTCVPFQPSSTTFGAAALTSGFPATTYGSGGVAGGGQLTITLSTPSTVADYTVNAYLTVTNAALTEQIVINLIAVVNEGDTTVSVDQTHWSQVALVGSDLVFDAATGQIASTAGGTYATLVQLFGEF